MATTNAVSAIIARATLRMPVRDAPGEAFLATGKPFSDLLIELVVGSADGEAEQCVDGVERAAHPAAQVGGVLVLHPGPQHLHEAPDEEPADRIGGQAGD